MDLSSYIYQNINTIKTLNYETRYKDVWSEKKIDKFDFDFPGLEIFQI